MNNIAKYPYQFCRTFGHSWKPSLEKKKQVYGRRIVLECQQCHTLRLDGVDFRGQFLTRSYVHPEDYHLDSDKTPSRDQWRGQWMRGQK